MIRLYISSIILFFSLVITPSGFANQQAIKAKVVVIPVREQIAHPELFILRRGLKEAIENQVDLIVLDMETPGGELGVTFEIMKALEKFPGKTITYINREAISAGALISAATDDIYFAPNGVIGAAAPVNANGAEIDATMREKIVSYLKVRMRSISEGRGYRGEVISAMIDLDSEFKIGDHVIKQKGELLSLTANEAMKLYGEPPSALLGSGIAENVESMLDSIYGNGNYEVKRLEITWSEKIAQYFVVMTPLLIGLGLLLLFIEFKTPGFGVFGVTGIAIMGIVFSGQFIAGLSGHEPMLFFILGVLLLVIELFFVPGVILGLCGIVLMLGSLVWAMADIWPKEPIMITSDLFVQPLISMMIGVILAVIFFVILLKYLPKGVLWSGMVLETSVGGEPSGIRALAGGRGEILQLDHLLGKTGVACTALFPSGQVEVEGLRYEARIAVGFADFGSAVKVTGLSEFGLLVEVI